MLCGAVDSVFKPQASALPASGPWSHRGPLILWPRFSKGYGKTTGTAAADTREHQVRS